jgi:hypothetical protein
VIHAGHQREEPIARDARKLTHERQRELGTDDRAYGQDTLAFLGERTETLLE